MKRVLILMGLFVFTLSEMLFAYDKELAKRFNMMFSQMTPEVIAKKPCMVNAKQLLEMIKNKEPFVILDVRSPEEMAIVGITWKDRFDIPMHEVFKEENLNKLPKDKKIVVICHTGPRSIAVTLALRALGFMNAYAFDGGVAELAKEVGRAAYMFVH
ncbi:hypothetical protein THC_0997 [Caldimicrobium thiodismutans]|uniref:Rhodanese domain-containing protein n=1 Tax=Caldimicrobium thiodismutans TaxID=1653476 RepID=A0A0U5BXE5_9BACT|nr:rhodanese-like domain-containing protein [Caldimicrobium thiodismutans]BAU23381.1 hypothetical protein THC_0997 [Caldimicrobium thiodismutans]